MKLHKLIIPSILFSFAAIQAPAQKTTESDNWALADKLGRKVRSHAETAQKRDKIVAMFYWTWHNKRHNPNHDVKNIPHVLAEYPEAIKDYNHPAWGGSRKPDVFFWGESLYGYYQTTDTWVLRKHAEMLADAGVDVVFFDCTNGTFLWGESFDALCQTWLQAKADGVNVPKVAFMLPFAANNYANSSLRNLYNHVYSAGKYKDLWFYFKGKPMIMAWPDALTTSETDQAIKNFFTFRRNMPDYVNGQGSTQDAWSWLEVMRTHGFNYSLTTKKPEQCSVGVAQNARKASGGHCCAFNLSNTYGRNYTYANGFDKREDAYLYGANFQEQWDRAIDVLDPEVVFVTGWNEFHSGMWNASHGWSDPVSFVDQYDWLHSRDIEPVKEWGEHGDAYYVQLVDNVRRFKGMDEPQKVSAPKTITIGKAGEWNDVLPRYKAYRGNVFHRDHDGYGALHYTDNTGRNDIVGAQVTHDKDYVYFRVETADKLTAVTDNAWMQLFIDTDRSKDTGWQGYDYVINRVSPTTTEVTIEKANRTDWSWTPVARAAYIVNNNVLEIAVSKASIGLTDDVDFEFKWNDNMQQPSNILDFYVSGDTAPGGRFNYVFTSALNSTSALDDLTDRHAGLRVTALPGAIEVETDQPFAVYTTSGLLITARQSSATINVGASGLYIVKSGNRTAKVAVK